MLNISIRQLRSLLAIHKHGKISEAAKALGLTSPAVTLQIKQLEEELDSQLFLRTRSGVVPTELGQFAVTTAQRILSEVDALEELVEDIKGTSRGKLSLGVVSTGKYFAPRMIAEFEKDHPGIEVHLTTANRSEIVSALENYEIDLALMGRPPKHFNVTSNRFGDHPLVFIAHPDNQLVNKLDITKLRLAKQKLLLREAGSGTRAAFEYFMADKFSSEENLHTIMQSNETIKQAVMADLGIALISGHTIEREVQYGLIKILDVVQTPIRHNWHYVHRADRKPTPVMHNFMRFLNEQGMRLLPIVSKTYGEQA